MQALKRRCVIKIKNYTKKKQIPIKNFFGKRKEYQKQAMKSMYTEATENRERDSTLNKSILIVY